MRPRVFVSSTYYDLKHIRSNIELFIEQYGFEPVLFESGNVTFEHDRKLDESCYNEVQLCHMMILIIGGRYGSKATENEATDAKYIQNYEENYISITRKEFKTAQELGIPIFVFIEKNVYAEYYTFTKNKEFFSSLYEKPKQKREFEFAHVDSVKIFEFIDDVKHKAIQTFEKFNDIESYLKSQWAGIFFLYLNEQLKNKNENKILDVVSEIKSVSERMNEMLNEVGKKLLNDPGEYQEVIKQQNITILKYFIEKFEEDLKINIDIDDYSKVKTQEVSQYLSSLIIKILLNKTNSDIPYTVKKFVELRSNYKNAINEILNNVKNTYKGNIKLSMELTPPILKDIKTYHKEIKPIIEDNQLNDEFEKILAKRIDDSILPF